MERHFETKPRKNGTELRINNPFDGDTGFHFNISCEKGIVNDWRGNEWVGVNKLGAPNKCTFLKFVQLYLGCSFEAAIKDVLGSSFSFREFRESLGRQKLQEKEEREREASLGLPKARHDLSSAEGKIANGLRKWLDIRGIDDRKIRKYRMEFSGYNVIWPYYEYDELVYWQSRSRLNKRFEFPPESIGVGKGDFIYGFDQVEPNSFIFITEAIFDAQTIEEQTIASGGASLTSLQARKIKALNPRNGIILAPDNDKAGYESLLANNKILAPFGFKVYYAIPPEIEYEKDGEIVTTKDWNELYTGGDLSLMKIQNLAQKLAKPMDQKARVQIHSMVHRMKEGAKGAIR